VRQSPRLAQLPFSAEPGSPSRQNVRGKVSSGDTGERLDRFWSIFLVSDRGACGNSRATSSPTPAGPDSDASACCFRSFHRPSRRPLGIARMARNAPALLWERGSKAFSEQTVIPVPDPDPYDCDVYLEW